MKNSQNIPVFSNQNYFQEDPFFQRVIQTYLPLEDYSWGKEFFDKMGELSSQTITPLALKADLRRPLHIPYDAVGNRIDFIEYDSSYLEMAKQAYEFGIVGLGHSPEFISKKRFYGPLLKFGLGYLFSQAVSVLYCPICMTDGTVQVLKRHASAEMKEKWIPRLTSMDMNTFLDGAMYLTEVQGGSDVGANTCEARLDKGEWRLYGEKWFCSNIGSKTALALARPTGAAEGTEGLGLFLVPRDLENGERNNIFVGRIKNKLGTCEMATAEVEFQGSLAFPVGDITQGFAYMTDMLNLSRVYNSVWAIGMMRRATLEAEAYAQGRAAFGKPIVQYPLVAQTLRRMKDDSEKALCLVMETISHMDALERGKGTPENEIMLRLLTPVIKFFTAEKAIEASHRAIEIFAGNGCIEDFIVAKMLRDSQILAVWEGTANILSLDLLRVLKKESRAMEVFLENTRTSLNSIKTPAVKADLQKNWEALKISLEDLIEGKDSHKGQLACREVAWKMGEFVQELHWAKILK